MWKAKIFDRCSNKMKNKNIPVRTVPKSSSKIVKRCLGPGLTKLVEVGEILALHQLKSPSLNS